MAMVEANSEVTDDSPSEPERELLEAVLAALRGLRYGSVVLTVHDGRLVEVQRTEKLRISGMKTTK